MPVIAVILIIASFVVGGIIGFLLAKNSNSSSLSQAVMLAQEKEEAKRKQSMEEVKELYLKQIADIKLQYEKQITDINSQHDKQIADIKAEQAKLTADIKASEEKHRLDALNEQQIRFDETIAKVTEQMKTATETMLKERQKEFSESSNTSLGQIVNPLRETIDKMKQAMNDTTEKQTAMSSEMKVSIEYMMQQSKEAKLSADELARVFRHRTKVQGDWGETVLDEILQSQGLTKGIHYDTQAVIKDANGNVVKSDEGSIMRPDIIMHLDQKRDVIIDSKVSMSSYIDYVNAENEDERQKALRAHVDSVNKHVKELSEKSYADYIQPPKIKMDYVIMFVPNTGALWTALNAQPDLWRKAMDKNVFIADEQTLFAALRIINLTWTQIAQAQNHEKVFKLANEMIDRVGQFIKRYQALGKALENAQKAYEEGNKKLTPSGQSILQTANKLINLGAKQSTTNPLPEMEGVPSGENELIEDSGQQELPE